MARASVSTAFTSLPADWKRYSVLYSDIASGEDTLTNHPVTSGWTVSTGNGVYGVNHLKLQVYGENVKNWIVSPFIEMNQAEMQLTFDLALTKNTGTLEPAEAGAQDDDKFSVLVTTDGGETWEELYVRDNVTSADSYDNINCSADGQTVKIDLSAYTESTIAVAFYGESTVAGGNNYLHIRNFDIDTIPSCEKPMGLQVQERGDTYAKLVWDEAEDASWEYAVVVDTAATFVPADADFTGSATGYTKFDKDDQDRVTRSYTYDSLGKLQGSVGYEYGENDNIVKEIHYDAGDNITAQIEYERDEKGFETKRTEKDAQGNVKYVIVTEYNEDGSSKRTKYDANGNVME